MYEPVITLILLEECMVWFSLSASHIDEPIFHYNAVYPDHCLHVLQEPLLPFLQGMNVSHGETFSMGRGLAALTVNTAFGVHSEPFGDRVLCNRFPELSIYMGGPGHNTVQILIHVIWAFLKGTVYKKQSTDNGRTETRKFSGSNDQHL
jgi:hypothetical protein